jgi:alpha-1,2-mannosyltransferase
MKILPEKITIAKNAIILLLLICIYCINFLFVFAGLDTYQDFGSFIAAGQLANAGKNPYSNDSPLMYSVDFPELGLKGDAPNLNPPISVLVFQSIAEIDPNISINIWRIVSILLYIVSLLFLNRTYPAKGFQAIMRIAWALSLAGFWHTIQLGQIYCLILFFAVLTWIFQKNNRYFLAGICLGFLIAIKPNFIFWAILLWVAGNWKSFIASGFTALSISIIPLFTHGIRIYQQWLEASSIFTPNLLLFPGNNSFQGLTARFGQPNLGIVLSVILALAILWRVFNRQTDLEKNNALGGIVSLLISPIAWTGYTLAVLPIFFSLKKWNWMVTGSAILFSVPVIFPLVFFQSSFTDFVIFGWFYGWGLLMLLFGTVFESRIRKGSTAEKISSIQTN